MNILVANDDGIKAEGIRELVKTLARHADVYVAAPKVQKSAAGHSVSVRDIMAVRRVEFPQAKAALEIDGTPADCVKVGITIFESEGIHIDAVFSGINHGGNLGRDTFYSGTVGAAREGCFCKKPAAAVSVNSHEPVSFEAACDLAEKVLLTAFPRIDAHTLININVPNVPKSEVKGLRFCSLGPRDYAQEIEKCGQEGEIEYYKYGGQEVIYPDLPEELDIVSCQKGYATITPLTYDDTDYDVLEKMKGWEIAK